MIAIELIPDLDRGFTARVPDLPVYGEGETELDAIASLKVAIRGYIQAFGLDDAVARVIGPVAIHHFNGNLADFIGGLPSLTGATFLSPDQVAGVFYDALHREPFVAFSVELHDGRIIDVVDARWAYNETGASFFDRDGILVDFNFEEVRAICPYRGAA